MDKPEKKDKEGLVEDLRRTTTENLYPKGDKTAPNGSRSSRARKAEKDDLPPFL